MKSMPVGILDSGVGGLSILRAIRQIMPQLDIAYYADTAHFPYGEKPEADVRRLVRAGVDRLKREGCRVVILACNTASTISLTEYQAEDEDVIIMGVTPLVKEAAALSTTGKIIVLATFGTLASEYYRAIHAQAESHTTIYTQACFDWVRLVESGRIDDDALIAEQIKAFAHHGIDTVVLGCTHFAFMDKTIRRAAPNMRIVEPGEAIAKQLLARLGESTTGQGHTRYIVTGDEAEFLARAQALLGSRA